MATVITEECINCGACEPECPNNAIYQGGVEWQLDGQAHPALSTATFYIVPEKCTECVGFFDHEACAAVCPVDCCVPDPNIPETEDVLVSRAKKLHPEVDFGTSFPSRFKKDGAAAAPAPPPIVAAAPAPPPSPSAPPPGVTLASATPPAAAPAPPASQASNDVPSIAIPALEEWEVPISCFRCSGEYTVPFRHFRPGVVFYCPHCSGSFVPTSSVYEEIAGRLRKFHQSWTRAFEEFREKRRREIEAFEDRQRSLLAGFEKELKMVSREVKPPGAPRRRSLFG